MGIKKLLIFSIIFILFLSISVFAINSNFNKYENNKDLNQLLNFNRNQRHNLMLLEMLEYLNITNVEFPETMWTCNNESVRISISFDLLGNRVWLVRNLYAVIKPNKTGDFEPVYVEVPSIKAGGRFGEARKRVTADLTYYQYGNYNPVVYLEYDGIRYSRREYEIFVNESDAEPPFGFLRINDLQKNKKA